MPELPREEKKKRLKEYVDPKFKASHRWKTRALFADQTRIPEQRQEAIYVLEYHPLGYEHLPCLRDLFLECMDPIGYEFAQRYLGGPEHFDYMMTNCPWFAEAVERWRKMMVSRVRAQALLNIIKVAADESHKSHFQANRFLITENWMDEILQRKSSPVGRPKKEEVIEEIPKDELDEALSRLNLKVIEGDKQ